MPSKLKVFLTVIFILISISGYCAADYTDQDARIYDGRVTSVGRSDLTVKSAFEIKFPVSLDTEIKNRDNMDIRLSDIDVGDYVTVEYFRRGQDSRTPDKVMKITVQYKAGE